jgi:glutathione peroxidase-family protein
MGSLPEMGGPMIGKEYCLPSTARYKIKHSGEKVALVNKWDICDENKVVVFQAIKEKSNANAPNSSWSFKYETRVQDAEGKLVTRFKFKVHCISKKTHKARRNSILKFIFSN